MAKRKVRMKPKKAKKPPPKKALKAKEIPGKPAKKKIVSNTKIINSINNIFWWSLILVVFLFPLTFSTISVDFYGLPKITLLYILTLIMITTWLIKIFASGEITIVRTSLYLPLGLFILMSILATIFSIDTTRSIFGLTSRYDGLITIICYGVIFFLTLNFIKSREQITNLIRISILAGAIVALYGILQHFGIDFSSIKEQYQSIRSISTLGNSVFLAGYLVLIIPVAIYEFIYAEEEEYRIPTLISIILMFICLIFTYSRAGWLAFGLSFILLFLLIRYKTKEILVANVRWIAIMLASLLILGTAALLIPIKGAEKMATQRLEAAFKTGQGSVASRLFIWKVGLKLGMDKPVLGYGPDTFDLVFPQKSSIDFEKMEPGTITDKAHNDLIQYFSTSGILEVGTYLWFLILFLILILRYMKKFHEKEELSNFGLLASLFCSALAYIIQLQFSFSTAGLTPLFWLLMALATALSINSLPRDKENITLVLPGKKWLIKYTVPIYIVIVIAALFPLYFFTKPFVADVYEMESKKALKAEKYDDAVKFAENATKINPYEDDYWSNLSKVYREKAKKEPPTSPMELDLNNKSIQAAKKAISVSPRNFENYMNLGKVYTDIGEVKEAIPQLEKAKELNAFMPNLLFILGSAYMKNGEVQKAVDEWELEVKIDPKKWDAYYSLGVAYEQWSMKDKAILAYRTALKLNPEQNEKQEMEKSLSRLEQE